MSTVRRGLPYDVVVVVDDAGAASDVVRTLLLAGIGAEPVDAGGQTEVRVVAGDGVRARELLGVPEPPLRSLRAAAAPPAGTPDPGRHLLARVLVLWALAFTIVPALGFLVAFWLGSRP